MEWNGKAEISPDQMRSPSGIYFPNSPEIPVCLSSNGVNISSTPVEFPRRAQGTETHEEVLKCPAKHRERKEASHPLSSSLQAFLSSYANKFIFSRA